MKCTCPQCVHIGLLIAGATHEVPLGVISSWNADDRSAVADWAAKTHLAASDNPVDVPPMPEVLRPYEYQPGDGNTHLCADSCYPTRCRDANAKAAMKARSIGADRCRTTGVAS